MTAGKKGKQNTAREKEEGVSWKKRDRERESKIRSKVDTSACEIETQDSQA